MTPDMVAELMRRVLIEALIVSLPILLISASISFLLSLVQTLTSLQDQTLTSVPRLLVTGGSLIVGMPWLIGRILAYTVALFRDFHRFLG